MFDDVIDALRQCYDIRRLNRREHADAQLIAPKFAIAAGVHDAVVSQHLDDLFRVDGLVEIDGHRRGGACIRILDERLGICAAFRPLVEQGSGLRAPRVRPSQTAVIVEPTNLVFQHDERGHGRGVQRLILA